MNNNLEQLFNEYINYCKHSRRLRESTIIGYIQVFRTFTKIMPEVTNTECLIPGTMNEFFRRLGTRARIVGNGEEEVGVKDSTIRTYWSKLNSFFEWLKANSKIEANPLAGIIPPQPDYSDKRALSKDEFERIIATATLQYENILLVKRNLCMLFILYFCGLRRGELLGLQVRDVDLSRDVVTVRGETSKSKRNRLIPINRILRTHLVDYFEIRKRMGYTTASLFVSSTRDSGLTGHGLKHWVSNLKKMSGVEFHVHRLRHAFATNLARTGSSAIKLQKLMGHTDLRMTERYVRSLTVEDCRNDIERLSIDNMA